MSHVSLKRNTTTTVFDTLTWVSREVTSNAIYLSSLDCLTT